MKNFSVSSFSLHMAAAAFMLADHLGKILLPDVGFLPCIGRLSFPIFAFCMAEGYAHTKNLPRYLLRIFLFALLSELPFDFSFFQTPFFPPHQNVLFNFVVSLAAHCTADPALCASGKRMIGFLSLSAVCTLSASLLCTDYGAAGVMTVLLFHFTARCGTRAKRLVYELLGMLLIHLTLLPSQPIMIFLLPIPIQSLAVLSLPLIWLYDGRKGCSKKWMRYAFYLFYPVHLLILGMAAYR